MSHAGPFGRLTLRWSVVGQPAPLAGTALIAGLPAPSARVLVGPPFTARGPSLGSTSAPGQLASPREMSRAPSMVPEINSWQPGVSLPAMIVFASVRGLVVLFVNTAPPVPANPGDPALAEPGVPDALPPVPRAPPTPVAAVPAPPRVFEAIVPLRSVHAPPLVHRPAPFPPEPAIPPSPSPPSPPTLIAFPPLPPVPPPRSPPAPV